MPLGWCNNCHENRVVTKINKAKGYRLDYCINKGCGYKSTVPYPLTVFNSDGVRVVNITHHTHIKPRDICECGMTIDEAESSCIYVNTDCKTYCVRNAMNDKGEPYDVGL